MNNNTSESEKTVQHIHAVGHGSPISSIQQVRLVEHGNDSTVRFTFPADHTFTLNLNETITFGNSIGADEPFIITITLGDESSVPPATLKLNDSGHIILTEEAEDYGWHSKTNLFTIANQEFSAALVFTGPGPDPAVQEIIIVGTVPTPR